RQSARPAARLPTPGPEERGTRRRAQERSFGMSVGGREEDARRLLLEARPGKEIRFHPERSEVPGTVRQVRLARGDGAVVVASGSQGLRPMEMSGSVAHLGRAVERLGRFAQESAGDLRLAQADPRGWRVEPNRGVPQILGEIRKA